eukprot:scaffold228306_cov32-Attheya_sp.AAC.3
MCYANLESQRSCVRTVLPTDVISVTRFSRSPTSTSASSLANNNLTSQDSAIGGHQAAHEPQFSSQFQLTNLPTPSPTSTAPISLTMTPTDEKILRIQQDLLRIQCNLFRLMTDVESLAADINPAPASATVPPTPGPPNPPGRFERDILIYGQRRAARRLLEFAVNAGGLLPREALGFTIEQDPS